MEEQKMVTCNLCEKNKPVDGFDKTSFRYVCNDCWDKILSQRIVVDGKVIDKDLLY